MYSVLVAEDDLLVHGHAITVVNSFLAELVQCFYHGVGLISCLICLPVLLLEVASESLVVAEELREVL